MQLWHTDGTNIGTGRASSFAQTGCMTWSIGQSVAELKPGAFLLALDDEGSDPPGTGCELWLYDALPQKMFLPAINR